MRLPSALCSPALIQRACSQVRANRFQAIPIGLILAIYAPLFAAPQLPKLEGFENLFDSPAPAKPDPADATPRAPKASIPAKSTIEPASESRPTVSDTKPKVGRLIELQKELEKAQQLALLEERPLLVLLGADWCTWCRKLEIELQEEEAQTILKSWVVVKVDVDDQPEFAESMQASGLPALRVLDFQRSIIGKHEGYMPIDELQSWLDEQYAAANPTIQKVLFGTSLPTAEEVRQLMELLADRSPKIRGAVQQRLLPFRAVSATAVVEILKSGRLVQQLAAVQILGAWKAPIESVDPWTPATLTEERISLLHAWLKSIPTDDTAKEVIQPEGQREIEASTAIEVLSQFIRHPSEGNLAEALSIGEQIEPHVRARLASELEITDSQRIALRELLYQLLASDRVRLDEAHLLRGLSSFHVENHRKAAEAILSKLSKSDQRLLDELSRDVDPLVRELTIPFIHKLGLLKSTDRLENLLKDKSPSVRTAVLRAYAGDPNAEAVDALVEYMDIESDEDLLVFAAKTLGNLKLRKIREAMVRLLGNSSWRVRAAALDSLAESFESSGSGTALSDELVDAVVKSFEDKDAFVVSRANLLLPKLLKTKNIEKIISYLVNNPAAMEVALAEKWYSKSDDELTQLATSTLKLIDPTNEPQSVGAIRLVGQIAPTKLKSVIVPLLEKDGPLQLAALEGYIRLLTEVRDQNFRNAGHYDFVFETETVKTDQLPAWHEVPESLKKLPTAKDLTKQPGAVSASNDAAKTTDRSEANAESEIDSFFGKGESTPSRSADSKAEATIDSFFGPPSSPTESNSTESNSTDLDPTNPDSSSPEPLNLLGDVQIEFRDPIRPTKRPTADDIATGIDDFFGGGAGANARQAESIVAKSDQSTSDSASALDKDRIGLPSTWMMQYGQGNVDIQSETQRTNLDTKWLTATRQRLEQLNASLDLSQQPTRRAWMISAGLASGELKNSELVLKELQAAQPSTPDDPNFTAQRLQELIISWLSGEHRLQFLQSQKWDWSNLSKDQIKLLTEVTMVDDMAIADWLYQAAEQEIVNDEKAIQHLQKYLLRALLGMSAQSGSQYRYYNQNSSYTIQLPAGHKPAIQWLHSKYKATNNNMLRVMLLSCLNQIDQKLATSTAVGYVAQASELEQPLTKVALTLALSDAPEYSVDRAIQWLSHPLPEVRRESVRRLMKTDSEYQEESTTGWLLTRTYFNDQRPSPGFALARREFSSAELDPLVKDSDALVSWAAGVLKLAAGEEVSINQCLKYRDDLEHRALVACALVHGKRTDDESFEFLEKTNKLFIEMPVADEPNLVPLKMFYAALLKIKTPQTSKLRSELRKKHSETLAN